MRKGYSRLVSVEEKKNIKRAVIFGLSALLILSLLFFYGATIFGRVATFITDIGNPGSSSVNDTTPPAPPMFNTIPDYTNQSKIEVSGNSEAGATIKLTFNGTELENIAGKEGGFSFSLTLLKGENSIQAVAIDQAGNVSQQSKAYTVTFDDTPPELEIERPDEGQQFFGTKERQVNIEGKTEVGSQITINDRIVSVDDDGKFQYTTTLSEGENKFKVKSTDPAGNNTEKELTLSFSP